MTIFIFKMMAFCRLGLHFFLAQTSLKSVKRFLRYRDYFLIFKMADVCNLGFLKSENFIG